MNNGPERGTEAAERAARIDYQCAVNTWLDRARETVAARHALQSAVEREREAAHRADAASLAWREAIRARAQREAELQHADGAVGL